MDDDDDDDDDETVSLSLSWVCRDHLTFPFLFRWKPRWLGNEGKKVNNMSDWTNWIMCVCVCLMMLMMLMTWGSRLEMRQHNTWRGESARHEIILEICFFLPIHPYIYTYIYTSIYTSINPSIHPSIDLLFYFSPFPPYKFDDSSNPHFSLKLSTTPPSFIPLILPFHSLPI